MELSGGSSYIIRPCREKDLDQVLEVEREAFPDPYDLFTFSQLLSVEPGGFFVAEEDGLVLGYVAAASRAEEAMIYSIAVRSGSRRRGIARLLMQAELGYLSKRTARVYLQVSVNNAAAIALYEHLSFVRTGRLRKYYSNGDDAILMSLNPKSATAQASVDVGGAGGSGGGGVLP
ncbi:MAG: ribosomal protein S18-alanine N-acetyltransferase [Thaumarchaeota archaeon]|nr:ribosomal protein S18-alanine N-acetyltransferase [Nitrososphaerota archaeon]MDA4135468.1 ribosomal protein S18-alanine N-acetyltransferase [Nitrososphaerota archaeon]